jgi:hypothetical protein
MHDMEGFEPTRLAEALLGEETAVMMIDRVDEGVSSAKPSQVALPPPARFSPAAKAAWDAAPSTLRAEVSRMEREFRAGFAKYKSAAERDASLAEFHAIAAKGGTTVKEALSRYVNMEDPSRRSYQGTGDHLSERRHVAERSCRHRAWADAGPGAERSGFHARERHEIRGNARAFAL